MQMELIENIFHQARPLHFHPFICLASRKDEAYARFLLEHYVRCKPCEPALARAWHLIGYIGLIQRRILRRHPEPRYRLYRNRKDLDIGGKLSRHKKLSVHVTISTIKRFPFTSLLLFTIHTRFVATISEKQSRI